MPDRAMVIFAHPDDAEIGLGRGGQVGRQGLRGRVLSINGAGTADRSRRPSCRPGGPSSSAAADFMGVRHVVMLGYPDGGLEDTREFPGAVVRAIRR